MHLLEPVVFERNKILLFFAGCRAAASIRDTENRRLQFREYAAVAVATAAVVVAVGIAVAAAAVVDSVAARKRNILREVKRMRKEREREGEQTGTIFSTSIVVDWN